MSEQGEQRPLSQRPERCESKTFDPKAIEENWYKWWEENGFFHAEVDENKKPFTIMIPPPNVTGALHLGHALNNSLQDVIIRAARMRGEAALWLPGTDHAGVATQAVVERRLWEEEGKTRYDLGRDALIKKIWDWKDTYEKRILGQLRRLGASADWERTQFTMSPELSHAVRYVFLTLFKEGLIYRGKRLINWSTGIQTALSNDELVYKELKGHFWYIRYPIEGEENSYIEVATTRPETMLGDTAVAVHPDPEKELRKRLEQAKANNDEEKIASLEARLENDLPRLKRYASLVGKKVILPLMNRPIPIVGDEILADPEKGTGAVKVTPAHDPNDYACGLRNDLPMINILNRDGTLNEEAGEYEGLHGITEGRQKVVEDLEKLGLLYKVEEITHEVAHCYRSGVPIEPYLSNQWFVKMQPLVDLARQAYLDGKVQFHPEHRGKDYMRWLDSTPDWCISRQIWWGHRIPIWYCTQCSPDIELDDNGEPTFIPENATPIIPESDAPDATPSQCPHCGSTHLVQDPDVLDTWFSSQLWPMSTLGWPEKTKELEYFYPTNVLITARDIIALWVARMIMNGMKFQGDIPFRHVLIHGNVLDDTGNIMSKSRGNGFDPLRVIEGGQDEIKGNADLGSIPKHRLEEYVAYGADAIRYGLLLLTIGHAQDLKLQIIRTLQKPAKKKDELPLFKVEIPRFEEGRRFGNKIWQASRGVVFQQCRHYKKDDRIETIEDRWLYDRLHHATKKINSYLQEFKVGEICEEIYRLFWNDFCSWYLEIIKPRLWGKLGEASKAQAQTHLVRSLDTLFRLIHPIMPYITEELWQELRELRIEAGESNLPDALIIAPWPNAEELPTDSHAAQLTQILQEIASAVNQIRSQQPAIANQTLPTLIIAGQDSQLLQDLEPAFLGLAKFLKIDEIKTTNSADTSGLCATAVVQDLQLVIPLEKVIDIDAEIQRLNKQIEELNKNITRFQKQLANPKFVDKAPAKIVQQTRDKLQKEEQTLSILQKKLDEFQNLRKK